MQLVKPHGFGFFATHPLSGWFAFGIMLVVFTCGVAWYFKRESDKAKVTLVTARQTDSTEQASLLLFNRLRSEHIGRRNDPERVYSDFSSSEDTWEGDYEPTYLQQSQRGIAAIRIKGHGHRQSSIYTQGVRSLIPASVHDTPIQGGRSAFSSIDLNKSRSIQKKLIMDTSLASTCSENTMPASRPISYREMKKSNGSSPVVLGISKAF